MICSQLKDDDIFVDAGGKEWKWKAFKAADPYVDFSDTYAKDRLDNEAKQLRAWRKVGARFCQRYGNRFTELGEQGSLDNVPLHFCLLLMSLSISICRTPAIAACAMAICKPELTSEQK